MNASISAGVASGTGPEVGRGPVVVVQQPAPPRRWRTRLLMLVLLTSVAFNLMLFSAYRSYFSATSGGIVERYYAGDADVADKIALVQIEGTITPPFTGRALKAIEQAGKDESVKGVVLVVDSPGGLVADSHEIYHALRELEHEKHKPIYVSMKRLAASGGYYVAMGAGPDGLIFAEPTTWTGSIGVLLPHYDVSELANKIGVKEDSLKTGPFKDTLSMFRPIKEEDRKLWDEILNESLDRFVQVIAESRKGLDTKQIKDLATGRVFTAKQAKDKKLIDRIGWLNDAIDELKKKLNLSKVRVVKYESPSALLEMLSSSEARAPDSSWKALIEATVPRAYYLFSSMPGLAAP